MGCPGGGLCKVRFLASYSKTQNKKNKERLAFRKEKGKEMTGKMKEMQRLLEEIEVTEKILGLLKDVRSHIDISVCMTRIEVTENITNFIRTEYELKLKKLERQWEESFKNL